MMLFDTELYLACLGFWPTSRQTGDTLPCTGLMVGYASIRDIFFSWAPVANCEMS